MKTDLRQQLLQGLKGEFLAALEPDERAVIEASMGEMGNKPEAVKLGWLKMRTKETWSKQRYARSFNRAIEKLRRMVEVHEDKEDGE